MKAPNGGDVGINGMIINIATLIVGAATNSFANAYFHGDVPHPLEAAGVCWGIYGAGAYLGYAGNLLVDKKTGASFNVYGVNGREFLVPWIYNPGSKQCTGQVVKTSSISILLAYLLSALLIALRASIAANVSSANKHTIFMPDHRHAHHVVTIL